MVAATRVEVFPGRLRVLVELDENAPRTVERELARRAFEAYPTLPLHSCINSKGPTFGDVAMGTSLPHLLEHLTIAEQVRAANGSSPGEVPQDATFVGTTEWLPGGPGVGKAVVEVSFVDDLEAIAALVRALDFLNGALDVM